MRTVPLKDIRFPLKPYFVSVDAQYPYAITCNCGKVIHFKKKLCEVVKVICPECGYETVYRC